MGSCGTEESGLFFGCPRALGTDDERHSRRTLLGKVAEGRAQTGGGVRSHRPAGICGGDLPLRSCSPSEGKRGMNPPVCPACSVLAGHRIQSGASVQGTRTPRLLHEADAGDWPSEVVFQVPKLGS